MSQPASHHVRALVADGVPAALAEALAASHDRAVLAMALRDALYAGVLAPGAALPSERSLLAITGLHRSTIRAVFAELADEGLLTGVGVRERRRVADFGQAAIPRRAVLALGPTGVLTAPPATCTGDEGDLHLGAMAAAPAAGLDPVPVAMATLLALRPANLRGLAIRGLLASGPVLANAAVRALLQRLAADGVPVVVAGGVLDGTGIDSVVCDHAAGAAALVRLLDAAGCRGQLRLWHHDQERPPPWLAQRDRGWETAVRALGRDPRPPLTIPLPPLWSGPPAQEHGVRCTLGYLHDLDPAIDAIHAVNDPRAWLVAEAWRRLGRDPARLRIVGFAGRRRSLPEGWRPWATVDKGNRAIGARAVARLAERLAGAAARSRPILVAPRVVQGVG